MDNPATEATVDIGVRPSNDAGAQICSLPANKPAGLENGYRILSIDGKNITGKSSEEIKSLLKGARGTRVSLQILTTKGEVVTVSVVRELAGTHPRAGLIEQQTSTSAEKLDLYDPDFLPNAYAESAQSGLSTVIEPYLTAQANIAKKKAETWFGNNLETVPVYENLAPFYDRIGRFEIADDLVAQITSILRAHPAEKQQSWSSHDYVDFLQRTGRAAQLSMFNEILGKKFESHMGVETNYALAVNALKAVEHKDTTAANDLINALIVNIEETSTSGKYYNRQPIWLYLNAIERTYVNRGQTAEASKLRSKLITVAKKCSLPDSALIPLYIDTCLTAGPNGDANSWAQLEKSQVFSIPGTQSLTIVPAEKLRRFALAYTYSADYKRSRMLLNRAKMLANGTTAGAYNIASALPSRSAHSEFTDDQTLTLIILDTAIVDLLCGKYSDAKSAVDTLLSTNIEFGQTASRKLAQIAFLYAQASHSDHGEKLLADMIAKSKDRPAVDRTSRIAIPGFYQWKLGELLIKRGQDKAALPLIDAAMTQYKAIGPYAGLLLPAAKLYERSGQYEKAVTAYLETQTSLNSLSSYRAVDFRTLKKSILESALACANKAPDLPPETKAKIVRNLAVYVESSDQTRHKALEQQEMSLLKPGSPDSVRLATSTTRRLESTKAPASEIIESLSKSVELAIEGKDRQTADLLVELAEAEVNNNQIAKGIAHAEQAIKLDGLTQRGVSAVSLLTRPGHSLAEALYKAGQTTESEKLLNEASAIDGTADSGRPNISISSKSSLAIFYFNVGETQKGESIVDGLFANYSKSAKESDSRYWNNGKILASTINRIAVSIGTRGPNQLIGLTIVNRLLEEQRKVLLPNDLQLIETLSALAQMYERTGNNEAVEQTYRQIMTIYAKHPTEHIDPSFRSRYSMLLHQLGKKDEADKLREMR